MTNAADELKTQEDMIKDKLKADSVAALKNHDNKRVEALRFLISLIDKRSLQLPPDSMREEEEISVLRKELKNKQESKEMFEKAGRTELVNQVDFEIEVLSEYLPKEMTAEEVAAIVDSVIGEVGGNFGLVMKNVMSRVGGRAGGDIVSRIVKEKLESQ